MASNSFKISVSSITKLKLLHQKFVQQIDDTIKLVVSEFRGPLLTGRKPGTDFIEAAVCTVFETASGRFLIPKKNTRHHVVLLVTIPTPRKSPESDTPSKSYDSLNFSQSNEATTKAITNLRYHRASVRRPEAGPKSWSGSIAPRKEDRTKSLVRRCSAKEGRPDQKVGPEMNMEAGPKVWSGD